MAWRLPLECLPSRSHAPTLRSASWEGGEKPEDRQCVSSIKNRQRVPQKGDRNEEGCIGNPCGDDRELRGDPGCLGWGRPAGTLQAVPGRIEEDPECRGLEALQ